LSAALASQGARVWLGPRKGRGVCAGQLGTAAEQGHRVLLESLVAEESLEPRVEEAHLGHLVWWAALVIPEREVAWVPVESLVMMGVKASKVPMEKWGKRDSEAPEDHRVWKDSLEMLGKLETWERGDRRVRQDVLAPWV